MLKKNELINFSFTCCVDMGSLKDFHEDMTEEQRIKFKQFLYYCFDAEIHAMLCRGFFDEFIAEAVNYARDNDDSDI